MRRSVNALSFGATAVVQTNDVDEARDLLCRAYLPLDIDPVASSAVDLRMSAVDLGVLTAGYVHFGGQVRVRALDVHSYHVDIPLSGQVTNAWDDGYQDAAVAAESAGVFTPDMPVDIAWSPGCRQICLMISAQEMRRQLALTLDQSVLEPVKFERRLDLTGPSSASWLGLVNILMREADRPGGMLSHQLAKDNLQQLIVESLLLMQPHNYTQALRAGSRPSSVASSGARSS